jgi:molecular chaperone DnaK
MALQRLKEEAEKAKIALSSTQSVDINLPFITADASGPKHLNVQLTRAKMEQICDSSSSAASSRSRTASRTPTSPSAQIDELVLVGGMTRMPKVVDIAKGLGGKQPHQGVNPDEVVAVGAAIQGGVLKGDVRDVLLLDVTPLTLGIMTAGDVATRDDPAQHDDPDSKKTQVFSTYSDNQPSVEIVVLQGERPMARDNKTLGTFRSTASRPAPRGTPQIEVTFDIDANGILHVSAKDLGTGKDQKITIQGSSGLSKEEVDKMTKEAELNAAEDKKRRDAVETRNQLDTSVYQLEKTLKDAGDKLPADKKSKVEGAIADAKKALESNDARQDEGRARQPLQGGRRVLRGGPGGRAGGRPPGPRPRRARRAPAQGREEGRRRRRRLRGRRRRQEQEITLSGRGAPFVAGALPKSFNPKQNPYG